MIAFPVSRVLDPWWTVSLCFTADSRISNLSIPCICKVCRDRYRPNRKSALIRLFCCQMKCTECMQPNNNNVAARRQQRKSSCPKSDRGYVVTSVLRSKICGGSACRAISYRLQKSTCRLVGNGRGYFVVSCGMWIVSALSMVISVDVAVYIDEHPQFDSTSVFFV